MVPDVGLYLEFLRDDVELQVGFGIVFLVVLAFAVRLLDYNRPGRTKFLALVLVTLWGLRLSYRDQELSNKVCLGNLMLWLLVYNAVRDVDDDDDDHHQD
mmetsp:Transcript_17091/g.33461  ORF Transcript_17091/g.33461 Transcript_17091/m.33461 type:complete len:100 (+) Transcript_17091:151-450(+)